MDGIATNADTRETADDVQSNGIDLSYTHVDVCQCCWPLLGVKKLAGCSIIVLIVELLCNLRVVKVVDPLLLGLQ